MTTGRDYEVLVERWQEETRGFLWPKSGRCCRKTRDGAPECCYQLVDGEQLTFTVMEIKALEQIWGEQCASWRFHNYGDGQFRYNTDLLTKEEHIELLNTGWMAQTLECTSHPLRPIVGKEHRVIGTVAIPACNTELAFGQYRRRRDQIQELWQDTVALFGVKSYYVTKTIKEGWKVL